MSALSADDVIRLLELQPHPERGYYRETFRDLSGSGGRAASTAIYYLLAKDEISRWHRIDAAEVWHWYGGAALLLSRAPPDGTVMHTLLGPNLAADERPQAVIPKAIGNRREAAGTGHWWAAPWHPDLLLRDSNWQTRASSPATPRRNCELLRVQRKVHFSTANDA